MKYIVHTQYGKDFIQVSINLTYDTNTVYLSTIQNSEMIPDMKGLLSLAKNQPMK